MIYYDSYDKCIDTNNCSLKEYIYFDIKNDEIINNRAITGDIVYIKDNTVIGIKERHSHKIVGILYLQSKIKYGTRNNKMLYLFKPTNNKYSQFYIPYTINTKSITKYSKCYCIIEFKEWLETDKFPIGTLIEIIGEIGIKENEYLHLQYFHNVKNNTWKIDSFTSLNIPTRDLKETLPINELKGNSLKKDCSISNLHQCKGFDTFERLTENIFSIDPLDSKDIDDSFHFKIKDNIYEVGIHIATPYYYFKNDLNKVLNRVSTVYAPNKKYNMLPHIYSDNICSLLEGKDRYAISIIIHLNKDSLTIEHSEIKKTIINVSKNYDYDTFDKIYNRNDLLCCFMTISNIFFNVKIDLSVYDSHKLVEDWMIFTNKYIATYLIENKYENIILRSHSAINNLSEDLSKDLSEDLSEDLSNDLSEDLSKDLSEDLSNYLKIHRENSATYILYDSSILSSLQTHSKFTNFYTHMTSPIRRAVDLYTHGLLLEDKNNILLEKDKLLSYIEKINIFTKNNRKYSRQCRRLEFIFKVKEDNVYTTSAYIISITQSYLLVYIPEYNLEEKIVIIPKKFEKIYNVRLDINNTYIEYKYTTSEEWIIYKLYQKLNVKLWVYPSFENIFDKLLLEIID